MNSQNVETAGVENVSVALSNALPFTHFETEALIQFDDVASNKLGRDYWRLARSFKFYVGDRADNLWVLIPEGFLSDGATVPRLLWWLVPPWGRHGHAAIIHDYLCEYPVLHKDSVEVVINRKQVDKIFNEAMKISKVNRIIRHVMYGAVRLWALVSKKTGRTVSAGFRARKKALEDEWRANPPEPDYSHYQPS